MAKRSNEPTPGSDKAKVRVFFAELEGNNESVQEALKTMVSAMSRPVRIISDQKGNGKSPALLEKADTGEVVEEPMEQTREKLNRQAMTQHLRVSASLEAVGGRETAMPDRS